MRPATLLLVLLLPAAPAGRAQCALDQSQELYDGGTSARMLPGYTVWQSFTPSADGTICRIDMGFFNDMSGDGLLEVREGEGTAGPVLWSGNVPVVGVTGPGVTWNAWDVNASVLGGALYTFELTPNAATLPDPYGVAIGSTNPYPLGVMGIDDPSGSYPLTFDLDFRTYMGGSAATGPTIWRDDVAPGLVDPSHVIATNATSPYDDVAPPSDDLLFYEVSDPALIFVTRAGFDGVRLDW
jgi:hypothetical protein